MNEQWKNIDVDGLYQVSDCGRIRRTKRVGRYKAGHILSPWMSETGYCMIRLSSLFGNKKIRVHRLVTDAFIPNPDNKPHVNHKDGNKCNNVVTNLEWSTVEENNDHNTTLTILNFLNGLNDKDLYSKSDLLRRATIPVGTLA